MANEIERKYLVDSLPLHIDPTSNVTYERHFLEISPSEELRIQRKGNAFYREHKITSNSLSSNKDVTPISAEEFNKLKQNAIGSIERDSYKVPDIPNATIKVYHGQFEGLIRAEVEFRDIDTATHFSPPDWFGSEITDSDLGRDSRLVKLSDEEFKSLLNELSGSANSWSKSSSRIS